MATFVEIFNKTFVFLSWYFMDQTVVTNDIIEKNCDGLQFQELFPFFIRSQSFITWICYPVNIPFGKHLKVLWKSYTSELLSFSEDLYDFLKFSLWQNVTKSPGFNRYQWSRYKKVHIPLRIFFKTQNSRRKTASNFYRKPKDNWCYHLDIRCNQHYPQILSIIFAERFCSNHIALYTFHDAVLSQHIGLCR